MIELAPEDIEISVDNNIDVSTTGDVVVDGVSNELEITFDSNEYSIVGDDMVVLTKYEDAPQWMKDVINGLVDVKTSIAVGDIEATKEALGTMLAELEVAKNTYELSIVSSNDINQRITTAIETLNSSLQEADATIMNIAQTATTPGEASAIALNTLSASLSAEGIIGSTISNLQSAFADLESTTANSISYLESAMEGEIEGNATAMETIRTYVGIDEAGASTNTGLSAYLEASDGTIGGADSQLANDVRVTAKGVESKFAYNSVVGINGVYKKSGFGLTTNYTSGSGTQVDPYVSEFWIDASRFKFTNSNVTGSVAPFTIDATGVTPQITFNGKVSFSNVTGTGNILTTGQAATDINAGTTTINGSKITTGSITAAQINTVGLIAENISANEISSKVITGGQIIGANIIGVTIRASYLDLDGELEVLTNFYLCVGGDTTGVPALALSEGRYRTYSTADIDAVPSTSYSNLYRIPSISTVREETKVQTLNSTGASLVSKIRSYNCANAGHNVKCVKLRPRAFVSGFNIGISLSLDISYRNSSTAQMYFGGVLLGSVYFRSRYESWYDPQAPSGGITAAIDVYLNGVVIYSWADSAQDSYNSPASISPPSLNTTRNVNGIIIRIVCTSWSDLSFSIDSGEYELPAGFNSTSESLFRVVNSSNTAYSTITAYTNSATYINNMI